MVYFNVVLSTDGKHLFSGCKPSIYFEQTSASSRFRHKLYHFWGPHSIEDLHYGALRQYGLQQLWSVLYLSVPVCVSFSARSKAFYNDNNNTESGNPSHFQKRKPNIYRLCLTLQFETPLLLTQWPFASGLYVGIALQEILSAVFQLNHRKLDRKCLGLQYTQCLWKKPPLKWNYYSTTNDL